jgi:ABC-type multidrug transport system ATPase subunit
MKYFLLDEPTSGMDPAARKYLWSVIKKSRELGMTIVLTTHSMDESEALCTRLGIMVNGQFKCLGSVQNLKSKFGKGYSLILKCKNEVEIIAKVEEFINSNISDVVLEDKQQETLFYKVVTKNSLNEQISIADIFKLIEKNKDILNLEAYSLSQSTLEQIFLSFAKEQRGINEEEMKQKSNVFKRVMKRISKAVKNKHNQN